MLSGKGSQAQHSSGRPAKTKNCTICGLDLRVKSKTGDTPAAPPADASANIPPCHRRVDSGSTEGTLAAGQRHGVWARGVRSCSWLRPTRPSSRSTRPSPTSSRRKAPAGAALLEWQHCLAPSALPKCPSAGKREGIGLLVLQALLAEC